MQADSFRQWSLAFAAFDQQAITVYLREVSASDARLRAIHIMALPAARQQQTTSS